MYCFHPIFVMHSLTALFPFCRQRRSGSVFEGSKLLSSCWSYRTMSAVRLFSSKWWRLSTKVRICFCAFDYLLTLEFFFYFIYHGCLLTWSLLNMTFRSELVFFWTNCFARPGATSLQTWTVVTQHSCWLYRFNDCFRLVLKNVVL